MKINSMTIKRYSTQKCCVAFYKNYPHDTRHTLKQTYITHDTTANLQMLHFIYLFNKYTY